MAPSKRTSAPPGRRSPVSAPPARPWLAVFFGVTFGVSLVVAASNFVVNPYGYYPVHLFRPLTWSSRLVKADLLEKAPPPDVLILGSSRAMKIAPRDAIEGPGQTAFNAAVDSARVEDWYALLRLALSLPGAHVKEVILGIDVEAFHDHLEPDSRLLTVPTLCSFLPAQMQAVMLRQAGEALLSQGQLMSSFRSVSLRLAGYPAPDTSFDDDGFLHYLTFEKEILVGSFKPQIDASVAEYEARFARFDSLDEQRRALFGSMLDLTEQRGIRVRGFITPLHASLRERLAQTRNLDGLLTQLHGYLSGEARAHPHFTWVDYTDPKDFGGAPDAFYDGAHARDESLQLIAKSLRK